VKLYRETALRKRADEPTIKMLDLWRTLSEHKVKTPIEVMVGNRREHPQLRAFRGELYTALPHIIAGKVVLSLWLDSLSNVNTLLVTHEIGHWVLKLQDFRGLIYQPNKNCNMEILLNSLAHHPPLYALQRSLGHEPQMEIDSRTEHNIKIFSKGEEPDKKQVWVNNAFLFSDDLMNCSEQKSIQLRKIIEEKYSNTMRLVEKILESASYYNLLDARHSLKFSRRIIKKLKLKGIWLEVDEVTGLISMVKRALQA